MSTVFFDYVQRSSKPYRQINGKDVYIIPVPTLLLDIIKEDLLLLFEKLEDILLNVTSAEDIFKDCKNNKFTVWTFVVENEIIAVVTTTIKQYPKASSFYIANVSVTDKHINMTSPYLNSESNGLVSDFFEEIAATTTCDLLEFVGRKGWSKWANKKGYAMNRFIATKKIERQKVV